MSGDPFASSRRFIRLRGILITSLVVLALLTGVYLLTRSLRSSLVIQGPTSDLTIKLNGNTVQGTSNANSLTVPVIAGQYRLEITRPSYQTYTQDIRIPNGKTVVIRPVYTLAALDSGQVGEAGVQFVRSVPEQQAVFYLDKTSHQLYRMDTEAKSTVALPIGSDVSAITDIQWPKAGNVAIITTTQGMYLYSVPVYNFRLPQAEKIAGPEIVSAVWNPNDDQIAAALFLPNGERSLVIADKRLVAMSRKADLSGFTNPTLTWSPKGRYIAVLNHSDDSTQNNVWIYTLANGSFDPITSTGDILGFSFSPDDRKVLLERSGQQLSLRDLSDTKEVVMPMPGRVTEAAWKDGENFFLPSPTSSTLLLVGTSGVSQPLPHTLPVNGSELQSMWYFSASNALTFATSTAIYSLNLDQ